MRHGRKSAILIVGIVLMAWSAGLSHAEPLATVFTYQGRLIDANSPAEGLYDFYFWLFDGPGIFADPVTGVILVEDVEAMDGYFTVDLDFGSAIFDGRDLWMDIGVRPGDSNDIYDFVPLTPRQRVTPAPYAMYAASAAETDPSVLSSVKDGVSWGEVSAIPSDIADGDDGITVEADPTVDLTKLQALVSNDFHSLGGEDDVTTDPEITAMGYIKSYTEGDPTVLSSVKDGITWTEVSNRPAGLDDGDDVGITVETDPTVNLAKLQALVSNDFHSLGGEDDVTTDPEIAAMGYIKAYTETDPSVLASVKDGVSWGEVSAIPSDIADGDDGITVEADPTVDLTKLQALVSNDFHSLGGEDDVTTDPEITAMGYLKTETDPTVNLAKLQVLVSNDFHNLGGSESDPVFRGSPAFGITLSNITNWNTAFSWGDHRIAGYLTAANDFGRSGVAATLYEDTTALSAKYLGISAKAGDSDLLDGQHGSYYRDWGNLTNIPPGFADGIDNIGITSETDPTVLESVKNGITWLEVSNRPAGLDDGDQVGITSESDPQVGSITTNYIPKWNGSALESGTIYDNGNIGIGTSSPQASVKLEVRSTAIGGSAIAGYATGDDSMAVFGQSTNGFAAIYGVSSGADYAGYFSGKVYVSENVGIGTISPGAKLEVNGQVKITGGSPSAGKVLTSDNTGLATWQTPVTGDNDWTVTGNNMYSTPSGNVGIGTSSPQASVKLEVRSTAIGGAAIGAYATGDDSMAVFGQSTNGFAAIYGVSSGADYAGYFSGNVYVTGNISVSSLTDRTPYPKDLRTAYDAVMSMERLPDSQYEENNKENQLDHSKLSSFIRSKDGNRDLSATVSCLNEVVKDLVKKVEAQQQLIGIQNKQIRQMTQMLQTNNLK